MTAAMLDAISNALSGDESAAVSPLESAGEAGVRAIHEYIDTGVVPPNAPLTVSGGWIRNRISHKPVYVERKGFNKPLYDTGQLYNDFDYEVKKRE